MSATAVHIIIYPFPASGHIIPLLDLTHRLLIRGLTITVLITPNNLPLLDPLLSTHSSSQLRHLLLPAISKSPSGPFGWFRRIHDRHYGVILDWFQSHVSPPPITIISDFFLGWTHHLACQVGIRRVVFSSSGAFAFSVLASLWRAQPQNENPNDMDFVLPFPDIPNSPSYPWWQISQLYRWGKKGDPDWEFIRDGFLANLASWGIVFNSFAELERVYLDHMKGHFGNDNVWAVGPLLPSDDYASEGSIIINRGGSSSVPLHEILTWLEGQKDSSVVYICFGSREVLTCKQMDELAAALVKSGVHFIWCVGQASEGHVLDDCGVLPDDFQDRVGGRGFIIKGWAPQVAILKHRAVGAFLTHCGWNSVLEGLASGVVMLTWPMGADQYTNASLVVDELGVGVRVGEETRNIPESGELSRMLAESVEENQPKGLKAKKIAKAALHAVEGGSSNKELDALVTKLTMLTNGN